MYVHVYNMYQYYSTHTRTRDEEKTIVRTATICIFDSIHLTKPMSEYGLQVGLFVCVFYQEKNTLYTKPIYKKKKKVELYVRVHYIS